MPIKKLLFPRRDLTNKKFSRLEVIKFVGYKKLKNRRKDYWQVKCECGTVKEIQGNSLVTGGAKSCGCLLKEAYSKLGEKTRKRNLLPKGQASFNLILSNYKERANKKKLKFELDEEQFRRLVTSNCEYCGSEPQNICLKKRSNGAFVYNGIDRLDNNEGYSLDNCITCCETCNKAKRDLSLEDFIAWIVKLTQTNGWKKFIKVKKWLS